MSLPCTLTMSVPLLRERLEDHVDDLSAALARYAPLCTSEENCLTVQLDLGPGSAETSLQHALAEIRRAIPQAVVLEAGPDLLPLDEIAQWVGLPTACLEELRQASPESFPLPAFDGAKVWHLVHVLRWVRAVGAITVDTRLLEIAAACQELNATSSAPLRSRRLATSPLRCRGTQRRLNG